MMVLGPAAWGGEQGECPRLHPCVCSRVSTVRQPPQSLRRGQTSFELLQATVTFEMNREGLLCLVCTNIEAGKQAGGASTQCAHRLLLSSPRPALPSPAVGNPSHPQSACAAIRQDGRLSWDLTLGITEATTSLSGWLSVCAYLVWQVRLIQSCRSRQVRVPSAVSRDAASPVIDRLAAPCPHNNADQGIRWQDCWPHARASRLHHIISHSPGLPRVTRLVAIGYIAHPVRPSFSALGLSRMRRLHLSVYLGRSPLSSVFLPSPTFSLPYVQLGKLFVLFSFSKVGSPSCYLSNITLASRPLPVSLVRPFIMQDQKHTAAYNSAHNSCLLDTGLVIGHVQEPTCLDLKHLLPRGALPPVGSPSGLGC